MAKTKELTQRFGTKLNAKGDEEVPEEKLRGNDDMEVDKAIDEKETNGGKTETTNKPGCFTEITLIRKLRTQARKTAASKDRIKQLDEEIGALLAKKVEEQEILDKHEAKEAKLQKQIKVANAHPLGTGNNKSLANTAELCKNALFAV